MARLSAHGRELFRAEYLTMRVSHRSDGHLLRNIGNGWKVWKKCKATANPEAVADRAKARLSERENRERLYFEFQRLLFDLVPFRARFLVVTAMDLLPDDPDGLYSELSGTINRYPYDTELSLEDCVDLCRALKLADAEKLQAENREAAPA